MGVSKELQRFAPPDNLISRAVLARRGTGGPDWAQLLWLDLDGCAARFAVEIVRSTFDDVRRIGVLEGWSDRVCYPGL